MICSDCHALLFTTIKALLLCPGFTSLQAKHSHSHPCIEIYENHHCNIQPVPACLLYIFIYNNLIKSVQSRTIL